MDANPELAALCGLDEDAADRALRACTDLETLTNAKEHWRAKANYADKRYLVLFHRLHAVQGHASP
jgi:hypothetical protein